MMPKKFLDVNKMEEGDFIEVEKDGVVYRGFIVPFKDRRGDPSKDRCYLPLKLENGPSMTRTSSPSSNSTFGLVASVP